MTTLHTFGDSHASKEHGCWDNSKINIHLKIRANWLGPKLMYSFGRDKKKLFHKSKKIVKESDIVVFSFGEIDCRCHIGKYETNWKSNIDSLVNNYFKAIEKNVKDYNDLKVLIYNVVPPIERSHPRNQWMLPYTKKLPHVGTDSDILKYTKYMNKMLETEVNKRKNYYFIDVYDAYSDSNGFLKVELSDNNCHIADPIYLSCELNKIISIISNLRN
jgi:hypothetical protein